MTMREARERSAGKRRRGDEAGSAAAAAQQEEDGVAELQSPTAQEIAEFLNVEMSPRAPRGGPSEASSSQQQGQQLGDEAGGQADVYGSDKQIVETVTEQDTVEDGWRCVSYLAPLTLHSLPSVANLQCIRSKVDLNGQQYRDLNCRTYERRPRCAVPQVAQIRPEDSEGQPQPAQLLQVHRGGLPRAQAGGALTHRCAHAHLHLRARRTQPCAAAAVPAIPWPRIFPPRYPSCAPCGLPCAVYQSLSHEHRPSMHPWLRILLECSANATHQAPFGGMTPVH